jgi:hypothetical protein
MSSPISPLTDRIQRLRQMGSQAVSAMSHPLDTVSHMFSPSPEAQHQQSHEDAIRQMNQQTNAHANDAANQSFQHPNLSRRFSPAPSPILKQPSS